MADDLVRRLDARLGKSRTVNVSPGLYEDISDAKATIERQAASLAAKDAEIEMLREAAKGSLVVVQTAVAERKQAEHTLADTERAAKHLLIAANEYRDRLAKAVEVLRPFASDDLGDCDDCVDNDGKPYQSQWFADSRAAARAVVAQHSDSREGK